MTKKFFRFVIVGLVATVCQYLILILLVETFGTEAVFASAIGFVISAILNYRLNYSFTFASDLPHRVAFPKFLLTATIGLAINTGTMYLLVDAAKLHYLFSQVAATGLTLIWNYSINSLWSFKRAADGPGKRPG